MANASGLKDLERLDAEKDGKNRDIAMLQSQRDKAKQEAEDAKRRLNQSEVRVGRFKEALRQTGEALANEQKQVRALKDQVRALKDEKRELEISLRDVKKQLAEDQKRDIEDKNMVLWNDVAQLQSDLEETREKHELEVKQLQTKIDESTEACQRLERELVDATAKLEESVETCKQLEKELVGTTAKLEDSLERCERMEREFMNTKQELTNITAEFGSVQQELLSYFRKLVPQNEMKSSAAAGDSGVQSLGNHSSVGLSNVPEDIPPTMPQEGMGTPNAQQGLNSTFSMLPAAGGSHQQDDPEDDPGTGTHGSDAAEDDTSDISGMRNGYGERQDVIN